MTMTLMVVMVIVVGMMMSVVSTHGAIKQNATTLKAKAN